MSARESRPVAEAAPEYPAEDNVHRNGHELSGLRAVIESAGGARSAILPHDLPEPVVGHRVDYWTWVENHADTTTRDSLLALRDHWRDCNTRFFDARMLEPHITLTEPSAPQIYGQCCSVSSWGSRLEIRLRPSLLDGTHPHMNGSREDRMQFVKDVLLHEMIHQHIMEHQPGVNEESYHGHGPVFTDHCNRIGRKLGLAEVVVRNRGRKKLPKAAQWPHCIAPPDRYGGAYRPDRKAATASTVTIPVGYRASAVAPKVVGGEAFLDIGFDPTSSDGPPIQVLIEVDAADELADFIMTYLADDDEDDA